MKALIVTVNIVLAALLAVAAAPLFLPSAPARSGAYTSRPRSRSKAKAKGKTRGDTRTAPPSADASAPRTTEEYKAAILDADIFNPERTPNAVFGRRNARVELALVGTIEAGKYRAAVIIQRTSARQINPFMRMMWGPGAQGPGGPGGFGRGRRFGAGFPPPNGQRRNNPTMVRQYVKLGETMPNGYRLTALSRTRATLTRGGDKMELELQAPSRNQGTGRRPGQRLNVNQQLQQAQLQTQQMMVRALMEMRNSGGGRGGMGGGGNRGGGGGNRGGRRR